MLKHDAEYLLFQWSHFRHGSILGNSKHIFTAAFRSFHVHGNNFVHGIGDLIRNDIKLIPRPNNSKFSNDILTCNIDLTGVFGRCTEHAKLFEFYWIYFDNSWQFPHFNWSMDVPTHESKEITRKPNQSHQT